MHKQLKHSASKAGKLIWLCDSGLSRLGVVEMYTDWHVSVIATVFITLSRNHVVAM